MPALAIAVLTTEQEERYRLLGSHPTPINVTFALRRAPARQAGLTVAARAWPEPRRLRMPVLSTRASWRRIASGVVVGLAAGLAGNLVAGLAFGLATATVAVRYAAFLLCTRRWSRQALPWLLGRFLRGGRAGSHRQAA
ncbi:hypothetical protein Ppa06_39610 [Planomonospora parontospora subsp. parontospora]|uniref:Uncharacterized protein n=2 Tax=Planomonospora parontospora TaxID=58119 RepID=A0AA37BIM0_9ACTN|nr:hypothetical protein [Planomonospora parontospora]GGK76239.1 hypothetical protein GCM10010126_39310 [Planomonospora parontospora]GII10163.1 hypothetical protein Ppa06_39610 [Planomonospora parontospora subsp. parontospora]